MHLFSTTTLLLTALSATLAVPAPPQEYDTAYVHQSDPAAKEIWPLNNVYPIGYIPPFHIEPLDKLTPVPKVEQQSTNGQSDHVTDTEVSAQARDDLEAQDWGWRSHGFHHWFHGGYPHFRHYSPYFHRPSYYPYFHSYFYGCPYTYPYAGDFYPFSDGDDIAAQSVNSAHEQQSSAAQDLDNMAQIQGKPTVTEISPSSPLKKRNMAEFAAQKVFLDPTILGPCGSGPGFDDPHCNLSSLSSSFGKRKMPKIDVQDGPGLLTITYGPGPFGPDILDASVPGSHDPERYWPYGSCKRILDYCNGLHRYENWEYCNKFFTYPSEERGKYAREETIVRPS